MNRIFKALRASGQIIRNPWLLNRVLADPDNWRRQVIRKYGLTNGLPVIAPGLLYGDHPSEELKVFTFLDGGSMVTDLVLLRKLARRFNQCGYFEIGTWRGESVANISDIAKECFTLNLSDEELRKMNVNERTIALQGFFSKGLKNVTHLKGNSRYFDFSSLGRQFDLIFIDGDHHYDGVLNDTRKVFADLVHDQSVVVWHDYGNTPENIRFEVLAGILDGTPPELHPFLYHAAGTKSAVMIRREYPVGTLTEPTEPDFYYKVKVTLTKSGNR